MADVTDATFETDVIERSKTVPVVVDLWAPWCGPCQSLGPILEKVIGETQGLVELAKIDVDQNPGVSQAFQVQSIPAVYAMYGGQVVNGFMGGLGEPEVVAFVQELIDLAASGEGVPADTEASADGDEVLDGSSAPAAADVLDTSQPGPAPAPAPAAAPAAVAPTPSQAIRPDAIISEPGKPAPAPAAPTLSAAEAEAVVAELDELLTVVKGDDVARERYIALLEELGAGDPRTNDYRRKLATALF